ncbi:MAG: bifunctional DNA-formamidopyrimidine glycosylase/DNA-(apurinic or apyrimidinic site) lyase [Candidatus Midichloria sp.]|nr:MAG: bifunctional DNA-formamidopyrimidine glycosylase/DNA-(apurinic or apyrimidinic site) lyase [Candidatus Midichloria sp.]
MPELPEVETIVSSLRNRIIREKIISVYCNDKKMRVSAAENFKQRVEGKVIEHVERRAKYILIFLKGNEVLVFHLGMSGCLLLSPKMRQTKHNHCIIKLSSGQFLTFYDPRRFGLYTTFNQSELKQNKIFSTLGIEPLSKEFTDNYLQQCIKTKKLIKQTIMDSKLLVGVGNIYASEALYMAGVLPFRSSNTLTIEECKKLTKTIVAVLNRAIELGGSTLRDYRSSDGRTGSFQHNFLVYNRKHCTNCNNIIKNIKISGRSSYYCDKCQR